MVSIVVADDHKIVREGLIRLLEARDDFNVVGEASNGEEAVALVLEKQPDGLTCLMLAELYLKRILLWLMYDLLQNFQEK